MRFADMKHFLSLLVALIVSTNILAQTDTEFWFVAPEITSGHFDSPILMRVSALNSDANVIISQPANAAFTPITGVIPAGTTQTFDLTPFKSIIENAPVNTVLNFGILLEASSPVSAYYEVNATNNPDIFSLKGANAKGQEFMTPFQTFFPNGQYSPIALSGFDIVATENNTVVTITPSVDIQGHAAGVPFNITLNRGQTYSCLASNATTAAHATGSTITSTKPICVTIKDDSMQNSNCRDMMGDQLVPTSVIGTDYIVMRGFLSSSEHVFVLATQNNTTVNVGGTTVATLNTGEQVDIPLPIGQATTFVQASAPVYVLHIAGFGCEMGGAILPAIVCNGSSTVYFTRSTTELFGLNIMVKSGAESNFILNGSNTLVPASSFSVVPGTSNEWVAAQISFTTADIPIGSTSVLTNTATSNELFHLGIINGGNASGCRYGYFSEFGGVNLGGNRYICNNDSILLDGGPNKDSYLWSTGETTQTITVEDEGVYWVNTIKDGCPSTDTVTIQNDSQVIDLGDDVTSCGTETFVINAGSGFSNYLWDNGTTDSTLSVNVAGIYHIEAQSFAGCLTRDTIEVSFAALPPPLSVDNPGVLCVGDELNLNAQVATGTISWSGPNNFTSSDNPISIVPISEANEGSYFVTQTVGECTSVPTEVIVVINPLPNPNIVGETSICEGELTTLTAGGGPFDSYSWSTAEITQSINVSGGTYILTATVDGCSNNDTIAVILEEPVANFHVSPDTLIFLGTTQEFTDTSLASPNFLNTGFLWNFGDGTYADGESVVHTYQDTGSYEVIYTVVNLNGCIDTLIRTITVIRDIIIPNAFSPNGDGYNDFFVVKYLEIYPNSELVIFNRWGNNIYSNANYKNDWDGENQPDGTYFYILNLGGTTQTFKGTIFMARN
jgi:gliding motility-associated-like protein